MKYLHLFQIFSAMFPIFTCLPFAVFEPEDATIQPQPQTSSGNWFVNTLKKSIECFYLLPAWCNNSSPRAKWISIPCILPKSRSCCKFTLLWNSARYLTSKYGFSGYSEVFKFSCVKSIKINQKWFTMRARTKCMIKDPQIGYFEFTSRRWIVHQVDERISFQIPDMNCHFNSAPGILIYQRKFDR